MQGQNPENFPHPGRPNRDRENPGPIGIGKIPAKSGRDGAGFGDFGLLVRLRVGVPVEVPLVKPLKASLKAPRTLLTSGWISAEFQSRGPLPRHRLGPKLPPRRHPSPLLKPNFEKAAPGQPEPGRLRTRRRPGPRLRPKTRTARVMCHSETGQRQGAAAAQPGAGRSRRRVTRSFGTISK
jgi:hypothetical protein